MESGIEQPTPGPEVAALRELSTLGKRIELMRIERGLSKQMLARSAGTSRQQLWRVMTGKSELTSSLCQRLAEALRVDSQLLRAAETGTTSAAYLFGGAASFAAPALALAEYLGDLSNVTRTLQTCPTGDPGRRLKVAFLRALQDAAAHAGLEVPAGFHGLLGELSDEPVTETVAAVS